MAQKKGKAGSGVGVEARRLAIEAMRRIEEEGAFANLLVPSLLASCELDQRDRNLVTEIAYGATRMRRSCDWLVDRFIMSPPPPALRASLRVGAYQLAFMRVPAHAAVSVTVSASAKRNRAPVNAILRKVADSLPVEWPNEGIRLSYPDWLIGALERDLGAEDSHAMLEVMNTAPPVSERDDGYIQDTASQWVVDSLGASSGDVILDMCAAPGGKATALAAVSSFVAASDLRPSRNKLVCSNVARLGIENIAVVTADGTASPYAPATFDKVLVDAPCSGLGVLRRRPDARWRVQPSDIVELADLQGRLIDSAVSLVKPGGTLVYSVCTVTLAETTGVVESALTRWPTLSPVPLDDPRWTAFGHGARLLPQDHDTDGMALFKFRVA